MQDYDEQENAYYLGLEGEEMDEVESKVRRDILHRYKKELKEIEDSLREREEHVDDLQLEHDKMVNDNTFWSKVAEKNKPGSTEASTARHQLLHIKRKTVELEKLILKAKKNVYTFVESRRAAEERYKAAKGLLSRGGMI